MLHACVLNKHKLHGRQDWSTSFFSCFSSRSCAGTILEKGPWRYRQQACERLSMITDHTARSKNLLIISSIMFRIVCLHQTTRIQNFLVQIFSGRDPTTTLSRSGWIDIFLVRNNFFSLSAFLILSGRSAHGLSAYDQTVLRTGGGRSGTLMPSATRLHALSEPDWEFLGHFHCPCLNFVVLFSTAKLKNAAFPLRETYSYKFY